MPQSRSPRVSFVAAARRRRRGRRRCSGRSREHRPRPSPDRFPATSPHRPARRWRRRSCSRARPGRRLDGHRRPSQERWPTDRRRTAPDRRHAGTDALRDAGRGTRPSPTRRTGCTSSRPASVARSRSASSTARRRSRRPRPAYTVHDGTQMIVGIVAERPGDIIGDLDLLPNMNNVKPLTIGLAARRPAGSGRGMGFARPPRLAGRRLEPARRRSRSTALRGWVAGGGRLIIAGGTAGPSSLSAFPDALLPYRPTATTDVAPSSLVALLGEVPDDASDLPALSGKLAAGRALATVGGQTVAAERAYGGGAVTLDRLRPDGQVAERHERGRRPLASAHPDAVGGRRPGAATTARSSRRQRSCRRPRPSACRRPHRTPGRLHPADRADQLPDPQADSTAGMGMGDDAGTDRRIRGRCIRFRVTAPWQRTCIVNEAAIVRGAPGATEGLAQTYLGVFSPTRADLPDPIPRRCPAVLADQR